MVTTMIRLLLLFSLTFSSFFVLSASRTDEKLSALIAIDFSADNPALNSAFFYRYDNMINIIDDNKLSPYLSAEIQDNKLFIGSGMSYFFDDESHDSLSLGIKGGDGFLLSFGVEKEISSSLSLYSQTSYSFESDRFIGLGIKYYPYKVRDNKPSEMDKIFTSENNSAISDNMEMIAKKNNKCHSQYIVKKGDWLFSISRKLNLDINHLIEYNHHILKNIDLIFPGDILCTKF